MIFTPWLWNHDIPQPPQVAAALAEQERARKKACIPEDELAMTKPQLDYAWHVSRQIAKEFNLTVDADGYCFHGPRTRPEFNGP
jgi:hypothetical protein